MLNRENEREGMEIAVREKAEPFARIIIHIQRVVHYTKHNRALDFYVLVFLTVSQLYDFFRIYQ